MNRSNSLRLAAVSSALGALALAVACGGDDSTTPPDQDSGTQDNFVPTDTGTDSSMGKDSSTDAASDGDAFVDPNCTVKNCASSISLGLSHGCAVMQDNTIWCWGTNANGQLAANATLEGGAFDGSAHSIPVQVKGIGPAKSVAAGWYHTCALLQDNSVWCWGDNTRGQLGQAANGMPQPPQPVPQKVTLTGTPTAIQAGGWHTCVLMMGGGTQCWGFNYDGQVGTGAKMGNSVSPAYVPTANSIGGFFDAGALGLGDRYTCTLLNGQAECLGNNYVGELGRGTPKTLPFDVAPGVVTGLSGVIAVAHANGETQCAVMMDNSVQCWGKNDNNQLLVDAGAPYRVAAAAVPGVTNAAEIAPGGTHVCARLKTGDVQCWGDDTYGQTGQPIPDAGPMPTNMPAKVSGISNALQVASGWADFSCALTMGGVIQCWGLNISAQLGRGTGGITVQSDATPAPLSFE